MTKRLLITGFDPFGGETVNPAWEAIKLLPQQIGPYVLKKLQIPTVFGVGAQAVLDVAKAYQPDVIVCVGQAGGRDAITPERIAVNIRDAKIPDNAGYQPNGERIAPLGPAAYFSTVDVDAMARAAKAEGFPAAVSNNAGAFVCNDVFYSLLHHYDCASVKVGFIHVPWLPQQGTPALPLEITVAALTTILANGNL